MELFDLVKTIFKKDSEWDKVSNSDKKRNYFMINRIMAIQFPIQADQFNRLKINPYPVVDWWHRTLSKNYSRQPTWIYTKTNKPKKTKSSSKPSFDDFSEVEDFIKEKFSVSSRELSELKEFFPDKYRDWLTSLKAQLKTSGK